MQIQNGLYNRKPKAGSHSRRFAVTAGFIVAIPNFSELFRGNARSFIDNFYPDGMIVQALPDRDAVPFPTVRDGIVNQVIDNL